MPKKGAGATKKAGRDEKSAVVQQAGSQPTKKNGSKTQTSETSQTGALPAESETIQKKPDTRTLIGGASWTGKLPVNLLSEHCQRQKWEKPEYIVKRVQDGFAGAVVLKSKTSKSGDMTTLPPMQLPPSMRSLANQPSAVEARHFAATVALFRVSSMKNVSVMLPPKYKDLWKRELQDLKTADTKEGKAWMYSADPFAATLQRETCLVQRAKEKEAAQIQREQQNAQPKVHLKLGGSNEDPVRRKFWESAPTMAMGKKTRMAVEKAIRRNGAWNPYGILLRGEARPALVEKIMKLGFRKSHVEEAVQCCGGFEETLEWLLVYVPEDDLPPWALPPNYIADVSFASGDLKRDASLKRLAQFGYNWISCTTVLNQMEGDELAAAEVLQRELLKGVKLSATIPEATNEVGSHTAWSEELETLVSIYGTRLQHSDHGFVDIELEFQNQGCAVTISLAASQDYPLGPPVMGVQCTSLPSQIKLSIIKNSMQYAVSNLLGAPMVFCLVDWLENEVEDIISNPGCLKDFFNETAVGTGSFAKQTDLSGIISSAPTLRKVTLNEESISDTILDTWKEKRRSPKYKGILSARQSLPAWSHNQVIVNTVAENQVTIIAGETGSGKSTQAVQFILDDMIDHAMGANASIICTQPRRVSAIGLADRVAFERCVEVGDEIGYAIRGEAKRSPKTRVSFVTTGVLLRRLQHSGLSEDSLASSLAGVSHIVVDEVHERSLDTDLLLILLRDVLKTLKDLRVILMSATLDASHFRQYFGHHTPLVKISGRTHPVEDRYIDDVIRLTGFPGSRDTTSNASKEVSAMIRNLGFGINYDLIRSLIGTIDANLGADTGSILIFLPGVAEINRTLEKLKDLPHIHALPLHASMTPNDQRKVFRHARLGQRKIIAATNVAETSITIEDVVAVIDSGRVKQTSFDAENSMVKLQEMWASRAACKQRRGRAGRVRPGICYKLFTRDAENRMTDHPEPEIRRVPLEQLCLSVRAMGVTDIPGFLMKALTPPESLAIQNSLHQLQKVGALEGDFLTPLGRHLATIPADLRCAKLMIYGAVFGAFEPCVIISSILTIKSPFFVPQDRRDECRSRRASFAAGQGDLLCDLQAYHAWIQFKNTHTVRDTRLWCEENFLSWNTLQDIHTARTQYISSMKESGFLTSNYEANEDSSINCHEEDFTLVRALVAGAFSPQIARIDFPDKKYASSSSGALELDPEARKIKYFIHQEKDPRVFVHPGSTLFDAQSFPSSSKYLSYFSKVATSKVFIRELTPFNAYSLLLFGGKIALDVQGQGLVMNDWLCLKGWARIGVLVSRLRRMLDQVLTEKFENPSQETGKNNVVDLARHLVEYDGLDH